MLASLHKAIGINRFDRRASDTEGWSQEAVFDRPTIFHHAQSVQALMLLKVGVHSLEQSSEAFIKGIA
jgi:hypothetical protein